MSKYPILSEMIREMAVENEMPLLPEEQWKWPKVSSELIERVAQEMPHDVRMIAAQGSSRDRKIACRDYPGGHLVERFMEEVYGGLLHNSFFERESVTVNDRDGTSGGSVKEELTKRLKQETALVYHLERGVGDLLNLEGIDSPEAVVDVKWRKDGEVTKEVVGTLEDCESHMICPFCDGEVCSQCADNEYPGLRPPPPPDQKVPDYIGELLLKFLQSLSSSDATGMYAPYCIPGKHLSTEHSLSFEDLEKGHTPPGWNLVPFNEEDGTLIYDGSSSTLLLRCDRHPLPGEPHTN